MRQLTASWTPVAALWHLQTALQIPAWRRLLQAVMAGKIKVNQR